MPSTRFSLGRSPHQRGFAMRFGASSLRPTFRMPTSRSWSSFAKYPRIKHRRGHAGLYVRAAHANDASFGRGRPLVHYIEQKTEARFRPFGLDVTDRAAAVCMRVKQGLGAETQVMTLNKAPTKPKG